jgi:predicted RND superfamily exporter protein
MSERRFLEGNLDRVVLEVARRATTQMPDMRVVMAGTPHVKAEVGRLLARELTFMVPIVLGLMALISCGFFRSLRRGLIPLGAVGLGLIWTLGAMGWSGRDLDVVTTLIPPLVLALGFAYATHVVAGFESTSAAGSPYERAERALAHAAFPVAFTALTTAAGFLSLAGNGLDVIRGFGLFAAFSTGASLLAALTLAPLMLARHAPGSLWPEPSVPVRTRRLDRGFEALASFDVRHANTLLALAVLVCVAAGGAATRIRVNLPVIENFGIESPIRLAYEEVDALFGGANQFYVMLRAEEPGAFEDPAWLKEVAALQTWLDAQPEIGGSISVVQYLEVLNAGLGGDDPPRRGLPDSASLVAQLLLFGANEELDMLLDRAHQVITILVRSTATETREFDLLARRIDARLQALPAGITGRATGNAILLTRAADQIARGQAVSLLIACGMIGGLLILYFRSIGMGLWALAPNLIPVLLYFGLLGATGVTLNNATALMGSIVLGIAVDDTLHLLVEYRRALQQYGDREVAIQRALVRVGRAITCTTLVVCAGLLVVGTSALRNQAEFGLLGAATLALAWFVDVTVTPALCHRFIDRPSREARVKRIAGAA